MPGSVKFSSHVYKWSICVCACVCVRIQVRALIQVLCECMYVARTWVCSVPSCREITSNLRANRRISCGADPRLACSAVHPAHFRLLPLARRKDLVPYRLLYRIIMARYICSVAKLFYIEELTGLVERYANTCSITKCFYVFYLTSYKDELH